jgi:hypothetical protein
MEKHPKNLIVKSIGRLFKRFHLMIFFVFVIACLSVAVVLINQILTGAPTDSEYTSSINAGSIDTATLERIQSLHTSNEATPPQLPSGRYNPFSE